MARLARVFRVSFSALRRSSSAFICCSFIRYPPVTECSASPLVVKSAGGEAVEARQLAGGENRTGASHVDSTFVSALNYHRRARLGRSRWRRRALAPVLWGDGDAQETAF